MKVTMMLANHVEVHNGLFYIHGGGWTVTGPEPTRMGLAILVQVPWDKTNLEHRWKLELVDADGLPVVLEDAEGPLFSVEGAFEVGRPSGIKAGTPMDMPMSFDLSGMPIPAGGRYRFQLWINDQTDSHWQVAFSTRPAA